MTTTTTPTLSTNAPSVGSSTTIDVSRVPYYQHVEVFDDEVENNNDSHDQTINEGIDEGGARWALRNFTLMSILFSANHGCVVACLGLASSQLSSIGSWMSSVLYITYTGSALFGATYIVKRTGSRNALLLGMALYCVYVGCFWVATLLHDNLPAQRVTAYCGAAVGGVGAGFLWTAQGAYFGQTADDHSSRLQQPLSTSTASLAGIFAFWYLFEEVALRLLSTTLLEFGVASWGTIFAVYTTITVLSTLAMPWVYDYKQQPQEEGDDTITSDTYNDVFYKATAAIQLLIRDPKMKHMIGLNAVFGFTAAFLNSYVNGEVVPIALDDPNSKYVGILSSWVSAVAAGMSLFFGRIAPVVGKGPILILGSLCFLGVVFPFVIEPNVNRYGWPVLILVYTLHGTGRATFEGTLKATFADYFSYEKEGAFANIIVQNGVAGAIGYILTFSLLCDTPSRYCVEYRNGTLHDVLTFELIVTVSAILAIVGYLRASALYKREQQETATTHGQSLVQDDESIGMLLRPSNNNGVDIPEAS